MHVLSSTSWILLLLIHLLVLGLGNHVVQSFEDVVECGSDGILLSSAWESGADRDGRSKSRTTERETDLEKANGDACTYNELDVDEIIPILSTISDTCRMLQEDSPQNVAYQFVSSDPYLELGLSSKEAWHQRYALATFYSSTIGMDATADCTTDECDWSYVGDCLDGTVVRVSAHEMSLTGTMPSELSGLSALTGLFSYWNDLTGTLPSELATLSHLEAFSVPYNQLSGTIPTEYGDFSSLTGLWVYWNGLGGPIPKELGNISTLQYLWVNNNHLTGKIPTEVGDLSNLRILNAFGNALSGTIPTELAKLTQLSVLNLVDNPKLVGPVPKEVCDVLLVDATSVEIKTDWCDSYETCCPSEGLHRPRHPVFPSQLRGKNNHHHHQQKRFEIQVEAVM